uniref:(California timema) hypothetical protein n=1 Tax=Timema californicum TaxID=61474 RepID=A0A7R9PEM6_TIMCA|nr:unnamed protein product [Timema californicum]
MLSVTEHCHVSPAVGNRALSRLPCMSVTEHCHVSSAVVTNKVLFCLSECLYLCVPDEDPSSLLTDLLRQHKLHKLLSSMKRYAIFPQRPDDVRCVVVGPSSSGAPNRPLPPTPDEEESSDRTLVLKRVNSGTPPLGIFHYLSWRESAERAAARPTKHESPTRLIHKSLVALSSLMAGQLKAVAFWDLSTFTLWGVLNW